MNLAQWAVGLRRPWRVYVDSSVFGGAFDPEFESASRLFFEQARDQSLLTLVTSEVVATELALAPQVVQDLFADSTDGVEALSVDEASLQLQQAYLDAGILTTKWAADALHVAVATVARCDILVSWNFRHIVQCDRIELYNAVNALCGYGRIRIHAPTEVVRHGGDTD